MTQAKPNPRALLGRKKRWLIIIAAIVLVTGAVAYFAAVRIAQGLEPALRDQAVRYLRERFHSDVELAALRIHMPRLSTLQVLMKRGRGARVRVDGEGLSMRWTGSPGHPPLLLARRFQFEVDLGVLFEDRKTVDDVVIEGLEVHIPPKGQRSQPGDSQSMNVVLKQIHVRDALLVILPKVRGKVPLRLQIERVDLRDAGPGRAMTYDAQLTIPKPTGKIHSSGSFGPWHTGEPGDSPLNGHYVFENADLGVFKGIAGRLQSTGTFEGTLDTVRAQGEASVPDFRLTMAGNPVPLTTRFEVVVDGTNGNTVLQPVKANLGGTLFTTTGAVIKHEAQSRRLVNLSVLMPNGDLRDLLRLAMKGTPFMEGRIALKTKIDIPALSGPVRDKLLLDGTFNVRDARFLRSTIQDQIDRLSRRGQGQPGNREIDEVLSRMQGAFRLAGQKMTFRSLSFGVRGAEVDLAGDYDLDREVLDFHGTLKLVAKVSQTMTGWKRWALKPVDPFFSKNGAGTFLRIQVTGPASHPQFGRDQR